MAGPGLRGGLRDESREPGTGKKSPVFGVIASGPSCTWEDAQKLAEVCQEVVVVNDCWRLLPTAQHLYFADYRWAKHYIADLIRDYEGQMWTQHIGWGTPKQPVDPGQWGIRMLRSKDAPGFSRRPGVIHQGGNSGYQACNLAYLLGAQTIILLGFDMRVTNGRRHWFGDHPNTLQVCSPYESWVRHFATVNPAEYGIEILNASRDTALTCFPRVDLDTL